MITYISVLPNLGQHTGTYRKCGRDILGHSSSGAVILANQLVIDMISILLCARKFDDILLYYCTVLLFFEYFFCRPVIYIGSSAMWFR